MILAPFFIMFLSTVMILHFMITQKRRLQHNLINYKREKDLAKSVLTIDLWFLLCYSPFIFSVLYRYFYKNPSDYENLRIWLILCQTLVVVEICFNFFVYLICNKQFRNYFLSMIGCCRNNSRLRQNNVY